MALAFRLALAATCLSLTAAASFAAEPAVAPEPAAPKPPASISTAVTDCTGLVKLFGPILQTGDDTKIEAIDGGCHIENVVYAQTQFVRWKIGDISVTGEDLFKAASDQRMPKALDLTATHLAMAPSTVSAATSYIMELVQPVYDLHLAYRWDAKTHDFTLGDLTLKSAKAGLVSLKGEMAKLTQLPAFGLEPPKDADKAEIRSIALHLDNSGLFESLAVTPLVSQMPEDQDPRPQIAAYKTAATSFVESLPDTVANADSKAALKAFLADFPHPAGPYDVAITAKAPISIEDVAKAADPVAMTGLLSKISITASHQPPAQK